MPDFGKDKAACASDTGDNGRRRGIQAPESSLRPLLRLRQLAREIQNALQRGDMEVMGRASNLLASTTSQWAEACPIAQSGEEAGNAEMARLTQETQRALAECETLMQSLMSQTLAQSNQVRQQQQRIRRVRSQRAVPRTGRLLDTRR